MLKSNIKLDQCEKCPVLDECVCIVDDEKLQFNILNTYKRYDKKYKKKEIIYHDDIKLNKIMTIVSGWVLEYRVLENGQRCIVNIYTPGDLIGFNIDENFINKSIFISATNIKTCVFDNNTLIDFINKNPILAGSIIKRLSINIDKMASFLTSITRTKSQERILYFIYYIGQKVYKFNSSNIVDKDIEIPLTQEEIADILGLTSVHVSRSIRTLIYNKVIVVNKHKYKFLDTEKTDLNYAL